MHVSPCILSLAAGVGVRVIHGLISVRSPASPIIALPDLLGMLAGQAAVQWIRGHSNVPSRTFHLKSFAVTTTARATPSVGTDTPKT